MWQQNYTPVGNSIALSILVAAIPILVPLYLLGSNASRWISALLGLAATIVVAGGVPHGREMMLSRSAIMPPSGCF